MRSSTGHRQADTHCAFPIILSHMNAEHFGGKMRAGQHDVDHLADRCVLEMWKKK